MALRARRRGEGYSFVACSGGGRDALDRALSLSRQALSQGTPEEELWATGTGEALLDLEPGLVLPGLTELATWLNEAVALGEKSMGGTGQVLGAAWVEAGLTVETLVAEGGLLAARSRGRVWALAMVRNNGRTSLPERPKVLAARSLKEMATDGWAISKDRDALRAASGRAPDVGDLAITGDAAALLVASLVNRLHGSGAMAGQTVGRAWRVRDDPWDPAGLAGGRFDDAGFPTSLLVLADGSSVVGRLGLRGHLRRPSFRDLPTPMFTTLRVEGMNDPMPGGGFRAAGLRIHRLEADRWILDLEGSWIHRGRPAGGLERLQLGVRPQDLVARCTGSTGQAVGHANGVVTPTLVFEGIRFD
ncbi:MAG: hypothetical protein LAO51_09295 [Acidobacteriia bacterium]|nr:hypothetical protein [Terriglobia bacterium]